ncbi:HAMP domain-containing protein [Paenibacillus sp. LHD-117]|uniref:HAMP domain-containing protein n=1 Tax=Paenibacillus sp. LHD-117 TaxID=3071412 RepID=UPI0027E03469|nr:HAMP domain-containing protein [Paenibacillus sp. LHD-117]MDQ6422170.1 HAMP domain-containing protein [Paenibacillus sp. LHD-117]
MITVLVVDDEEKIRDVIVSYMKNEGFPYIAKRISTPLLDMKWVTERIANGQLDARVRIDGKNELADLGTSLNELAQQLQMQEQLRKTMTEEIAHELRTPLTKFNKVICGHLKMGYGSQPQNVFIPVTKK